MEPEEQTDAGEITDTNQDRGVGRWFNRILWLAVSTAVVTGVAWGVTQLLSNVNTHDVETLTDFDAIDSNDKLGGGQYLIPSPIEDVGPPPLRADTCNGRYQWAHSKSAIDVSSTLSRVTVTAKKDHQVQIIGARRVPVGEQKSPALGSMLTCPGAGAPPVRHVYINLDTGDMAYFDGESDQPQQELNIPVEGGKTEVLDIQAQTEQYDWTYKIELVLLVDGEEVVETINDNKPFRTTAPTNAKQYRWIDNDWRDVTPGSGQPPPIPNVPVTLPNACTLLTPQESSAVIGQQLTQRENFPSAPNTTQDGRVVVVSFCNHISENMDSVQVSVVEAPTAEEARREFQYELELIDPNGQAQNLAGFRDAKIIDGWDVLLLRDKRVLRVNIVRQGNQSNPLDVKYVTSLLKIAAGRI